MLLPPPSDSSGPTSSRKEAQFALSTSFKRQDPRCTNPQTHVPHAQCLFPGSLLMLGGTGACKKLLPLPLVSTVISHPRRTEDPAISIELFSCSAGRERAAGVSSTCSQRSFAGRVHWHTFYGPIQTCPNSGSAEAKPVWNYRARVPAPVWKGPLCAAGAAALPQQRGCRAGYAANFRGEEALGAWHMALFAQQLFFLAVPASGWVHQAGARSNFRDWGRWDQEGDFSWAA